MKDFLTPVVLVLAADIPPDALHLTGELLRQFGVGYREITLDINELRLEAFIHEAVEETHAIIVASADQATATAVARTGLPVVRVPVAGVDHTGSALSLLLPARGEASEPEEAGEGFATVAIGSAGARNAALLVIAMLAAQGDERLRQAWAEYRQAQTETVLGETLPALS